MSNRGQGALARWIPKDISEKIRRIWEFRPDDFRRGWQVPPAKLPQEGLEGSKGFRYPAPNSQPQANVPATDNPDLTYDIGYYKRDTRRAPRNIYTYTAPSLRAQLSDGSSEARALLADKVPADKVVVPSKGNKNPAVLKYDPTGLRSAMSATNAEMEKSIQSYMPDHNVRPSWIDEGIDIVKEAEDKGLPPPPGRPYKW